MVRTKPPKPGLMKSGGLGPDKTGPQLGSFSSVKPFFLDGSDFW